MGNFPDFVTDIAVGITWIIIGMGGQLGQNLIAVCTAGSAVIFLDTFLCAGGRYGSR